MGGNCHPDPPKTTKHQKRPTHLGVILKSFCSPGATFWEVFFSRKLSELGSRLDFGVQGLGRGVGAAAGQKWSFRVRRMSISLSPSPLSCDSLSFVKDIGKNHIKIVMFRKGSHLLSIWAPTFSMRRRGTWCMSPSPLSCNS